MFDDHEPDNCFECDSSDPVSSYGLCEHCTDSLQFIVRPQAHREMEHRSFATDEAIKELERQGVVIFRVAPDDNFFWVCDFCNTELPVDDDITLVPLLSSYALCPPCVAKLPYWPGAWTDPIPRACPCDACQLPIVRAQMAMKRAQHRDIEARGIA